MELLQGQVFWGRGGENAAYFKISKQKGSFRVRYISSFNKCELCTYCVTDPILGTRNRVMDKMGALCCFRDTHFSGKDSQLINQKLNN